ncbi:lipase family protein [Carnobacterium divergens]|uniref:lipase family protein n=1 Tax=Carnobacterium divergens TaxID=2748 RepID=UPI00288CB1FC|nr:hypothetical protein [Carnobacterium divergens]MDT2012600.1 DUF2974 domain-containing protein [Carnobacterium divergens]
MHYSDEERVQIAEKEYRNYSEKEIVKINSNKISVGYVSQVNDKPTGEQSFVITNDYVSPDASLKERESVREVTVLYRGSTAPTVTNILNPLDPDFKDVRSDWVKNDLPTAIQILNGGAPTVTPQLKSSSETLEDALKLYPNAKINVYGHSLGSMNAQYALANVSKSSLERIEGSYVYQGPNIYSLLSPEQRLTADQLTTSYKVFNYIDQKDLVPLGYGDGKKTVGAFIPVEATFLGMFSAGAQHMWGGYHYKKGALVTTTEGNALLAKANTSKELARLDILKQKFSTSGGGSLSSSQEIFLDAMEARAITRGYKQTVQTEIDGLKKWFKTEIENARELWKHTQSDAERWGEHLTMNEIMETLASSNVTKGTILNEPVNEYEQSLAVLKSSEQEITILLKNIQEAIDKQLATDKELANFYF